MKIYKIHNFDFCAQTFHSYTDLRPIDINCVFALQNVKLGSNK